MVMEAVHITVLQRLLAGDVLGRVFGIMDTLIYGGILAGSLLATLAYRALGLRAALLIVSAIIALIAVTSLKRLQAIEGRSPLEEREDVGKGMAPTSVQP